MVKINIKNILKEQGKTKYWLVKHMEASYQSLSSLMKKETTGIKFETLEKLCHLLNCTPNDIIEIQKD